MDPGAPLRYGQDDGERKNGLRLNRKRAGVLPDLVNELLPAQDSLSQFMQP
jgi:hypothetical protein